MIKYAPYEELKTDHQKNAATALAAQYGQNADNHRYAVENDHVLYLVEKDKGWKSHVFDIALSTIFISVSAGFVIFEFWERIACLKLIEALAIVWSIAPPAYLLIQWAFFWHGPPSGPDFERFKMSQDRAKDLWLGGAGLLAAIVFGH